MRILLLLLVFGISQTAFSQSANYTNDSSKKLSDSILLAEINNQNIILLDSIKQNSQSTLRMIEELKKESGRNQFTTNIETILLALIAAFIALYQVKANIVSQARIKWIQDLRHSVSEFLESSQHQQAQFADIIDKQRRTGIQEYPDFWDDFGKFNQTQSANLMLHSKIKLYLSTDNLQHKAIEYKLDEIQNKLSIKNKNMHTSENGNEISKLVGETIDLCKIVFKEEWKKSKRIFRN